MDPLVLGLAALGFCVNNQLRLHSRRSPNNEGKTEKSAVARGRRAPLFRGDGPHRRLGAMAGGADR